MQMHDDSTGQNGSHSADKTTDGGPLFGAGHAAVLVGRKAMRFSLPEVLASVSRNRAIVLAFGCAALVGAVLVGTMWPRTYRSEAKLYVRLGRENMGLDATASLGHEVTGIQISREEELNTVVDLLKSQSLLEKVVDAVGPETVLHPNAVPGESSKPSILGYAAHSGRQFANWLQNDVPLPPRDLAVITLRKQLEMQNIRKTDVILVAHQGPNAAASQRIVSTLINLYLDQHVRMSRSPHAHAFLVEQATSIKSQLVQRENDLRAFKDKTGLASPAEQRQTLVSQIGRLEDDLKTTLANIEAMAAENREIVAEQGTASAVDSRGHDELRLALLKQKPALAALRAKSALLRTQLAEAKEQLLVLNGNENHIQGMQRDAQILDASYRKYAGGLEQARLDESLEHQRISNINVAQEATLSPQPVKPQRSLFLAGGLLVAVLGGPALAVLLDAYRSLARVPRTNEYRIDVPGRASTVVRDARPVGA
jgi:polysaccharide biosynthesis protein PslE